MDNVRFNINKKSSEKVHDIIRMQILNQLDSEYRDYVWEELYMTMGIKLYYQVSAQIKESLKQEYNG